MSTFPSVPTFDPKRRYTVEEYFALEAASEEKYEYREGSIVNVREAQAMAGGSPSHVGVTFNLAGLLHRQLKPPCRGFVADLRVRIARKQIFVYPDLAVVCEEPQYEKLQGLDTLINPRLIVEVLSPSTERYDRGEKFDRYREISTLAEYVLVSQSEHRVESFLRQDDGTWLFSPATGPQAVARFRSIGVDVPLAAVYANITFPPIVAEPIAESSAEPDRHPSP